MEVKMNKIENGGWTLVEMMCTLIVMAIITIGALWGYKDLRFKYNEVKITDTITELASNIQTKFMEYPDYMGINTAKVKDMEIIPAGIKYDKAMALHHPLGGRMDVFAVDNLYSGVPAEYFAIRLQNLPADMCTALGSIRWDNNMTSGLIAMEIIAKPDYNPSEQIANIKENCTGIDADLFAVADKGYALACKNGSRQGFPMHPRYAWKACNCTENTCMMTWIYK